MTTEIVVVRGAGVTLDQLVWRRYRRPVPRLVERVLALNPGLAALGPYLPIDTAVALPVLEPTEETQGREIVQLWD